MLGKIEGKRRKGWQRIRWLDSITDSVDTNLSKLWETVGDRGAWPPTVREFAKGRTLLRDWATTTTTVLYFHCEEPPSAYWCSIPGSYSASCQDVPVAARRMDWGLWPRPGLSEHTFSWPSKEVMAKQRTQVRTSGPIRPIPESLTEWPERRHSLLCSAGLRAVNSFQEPLKEILPNTGGYGAEGRKESPHDVTRSLDQVIPETGWVLF